MRGSIMVSPLLGSTSISSVFFVFFMTFIALAQGDCGPPPEVNHTKPIPVTTFSVGVSVVYQCDRDSGYYENPGMSKTITCQDDSTWTQISELCIRACKPPPRLQYGELKQTFIDMNVFIKGQEVEYSCRPGYRRAPRTVTKITCQEDFTWSAPEEFCIRKSCSNPGEIENGEMLAENFLFGSRVTYTCNEGFRMITRRNYRDCQADGTWTNELPVCDAQICTPPDTSGNLAIISPKDQYQYLDSISYECKNGLELIGTAYSHCTANGTWGSSPPECKGVNCPEPVVPNSVKESGFVGPYKLNFGVTFKCKEVNIMIGSSSVKCNADSQWTPELPQCVDGCYSPPVKNSEELNPNYRTQTIFLKGARVEYSCVTGYEARSELARTCNGRLEWTDMRESLCTPILCADPGQIKNAHRQDDSSEPKFAIGSTVTYTCKQGYQMSSLFNSRTCQTNKQWSNEPPVCIGGAINCSQIQNIANGSHKPKKDEYEPPETVHFTCNSEFELIGEESIFCKADGTWSNNIPQCKERPPTPTGLIVGIIVAVIVCILVVIICLCCHKKKRGIYNAETLQNTLPKYEKAVDQTIIKPEPANYTAHYTTCKD
ncbi:complement receptor type 1-like isoform X1 [Pelobates fuscus]|uniref:complement receptor type 1-like isoform X1 n=1 Tax=Pelobates fuscus TaxID=191477 RepID=UPI002FE43AA3